ncbi:MAG: hypothetical protein AABZ04_10570 [Pseudomonadota bacterium]
MSVKAPTVALAAPVVTAAILVRAKIVATLARPAKKPLANKEI